MVGVPAVIEFVAAIAAAFVAGVAVGVGAVALWGTEKVCTCLVCGCDDFHACITPAGACHWLWHHRRLGVGVCSACTRNSTDPTRYA